MNRIDSFRGEYRFLSNFWMSPSPMGNIWYPSVEHAYQAAKTLVPEERDRIKLASTPGEAKKLGRKVTLRPDWEQVKIEWMEFFIWYKFVMFPELGKRLLDTGDAELIEGNTWGDTFWGVCNGVGQNWLGKILMKTRDIVRALGKVASDGNAPQGARVDRVFIPRPNHIFVFGSNRSGVHGAGAALDAHTKYGAEIGVGEGLTGMSYAIPTKDHNIQTLPLSDVKNHVDTFIMFAWERTDLTFFVTRIGCGLAGYTDEQISPLFEDAPPNCELPYGWGPKED